MDYDDDFFMHWSELMSLIDIAEIVMKHFGEKIDMGKTLNQAFNEIPFCYSLDDNYYELNSSQKMDDLLYNYVSAGNEVTAEQERELIISLEKRLEHGNQIKIDYVAARGSNTTLPDDTFMQCKRRIMLVLASARKKINEVKMYGSIDKIYSSPTPAIMPFNPNRQPQIKLATRDPVTGQSTAKQILATRTDSTAVPPLARSACCHSCGSEEHILTDCPVLYWSDTNTDHHIDWINSKVGKLWAQQGHKKRMPELIRPGYEKLVLLQPLGTPPNAMNSVADNNNNKR